MFRFMNFKGLSWNLPNSEVFHSIFQNPHLHVSAALKYSLLHPFLSSNILRASFNSYSLSWHHLPSDVFQGIFQSLQAYMFLLYQFSASSILMFGNLLEHIFSYEVFLASLFFSLKYTVFKLCKCSEM